MTLVVAYKPGPGSRAALSLAVEMARSSGRRLVTVTVVAAPWPTPGLAKVDAEFRDWAREQGEVAVSTAQEDAAEIAGDVEVECTWRHGKSVPRALLAACEEHDAEMVVVGSAVHGGFGQVVLGSTADHLLHTSSIPVAVATRGYRCSKGGRLRRVTCCYAGDDMSDRVLSRVAAVAADMQAPLRVVTFALSARHMYPPEVGFDTERDILRSWSTQVAERQREALAGLATPVHVQTETGTGHSWEAALDSIEWSDHEVLVVGSSRSVVSRVFLGSRASKIVRHSPVPVVVVPAGRR